MAALAFPTGQGAGGAKTIFHQTCAPTGWVKCTSAYNCYSLRVVTGTPGSGGTQPFSTAFTSGVWTATNSFSGGVGTTFLTSCTMPKHTHPGGSPSFRTNVKFTNLVSGSNPGWITAAYDYVTAPYGGVGHTHSVSSAISYTGNPYNFAVNYVDFIVAIKS